MSFKASHSFGFQSDLLEKSLKDCKLVRVIHQLTQCLTQAVKQSL